MYLLYWKLISIPVHVNDLVLNTEGNTWRKSLSAHLLPVSKSEYLLFIKFDPNIQMVELQKIDYFLQQRKDKTKCTEEYSPRTARLNEMNFSPSCFNLPDLTFETSWSSWHKNEELQQPLNPYFSKILLFKILPQCWQTSVGCLGWP